MKHIILAILAILTILSCNNDNNDTQHTPSTTPITFRCQGIDITTEPLSRSTLAGSSLTDLWIWEGTTLLKHQTSTDTDFGTPTIALTYGQHTLTFVASMSLGQTWANGVWSCTKVDGDYAKVVSVNVSGNTQGQQVELTRRNARIKFITTDVIPTTVTQCHIKVDSHLSLASDLTATNATPREATIDITSKQGGALSVFANVLTESATEEEDTEVMIEFLDASNVALFKYERTVKLKANRCVTLTGEFFSGSSTSVSIASTEWENVTQELFPSE